MQQNIYVQRIAGLFFSGILLFLVSCSKDPNEGPGKSGKVSEYDSELAVRWNELYLDLERHTPGYRPPVSGRALAYISLAAYESVWPGMAESHRSVGRTFAGLELPEAAPGLSYHWPSSLVAAYVRSLELFFPTGPGDQRVKAYRLQNEYFEVFKQEVPFDAFQRSTDFGRRVAEAVYQWSATDEAGHEAYLRNHDAGYLPPAGPGLWQPTAPDFTPALLPHWGLTRTFAAGAEDTVAAPLPYSEQPGSSLYEQAEEVETMVSRIKAGELPEERWIAEFWSDDCAALTFTPAGRWIAIANQVVDIENPPLNQAVELYARLGMALNDAGVRCWQEKYRFNVERPLDYIRRVQGQTDWNTLMCPDGTGRYFTPPFPAYPSGHATFGAAAAEVLASFFGSNYGMTDRCHEGRAEFNGTPRTFDSFHAMAEENAWSRIPLGVHFRMDAEAGLRLGYRVGQKVNGLEWRK